jgi:hypothetical protein
MSSDRPLGWEPGDAIGYIQPEIQEFDLPPYEGERYGATVPDTLDLQERAKLAIHGLTEPTDPSADYEVYWIVYFSTNPPQMIHNFWHGPTIPKFMWAVSLMRHVSGSEQNLHVEHRWAEAALRSQGTDGLIYTPRRGRPWAHEWYPPHAAAHARRSRLGLADQDRFPFGNATMLSTLAHFAKRDADRLWRDALRRIVDGIIELAVDTGDMAFFWPSILAATREHPLHPSLPIAPYECEGSVVPHGLVHAYRVLGHEPALKLAGKYINYLRHTFYEPDGSFLASPDEPMHAHFHAHARGLLAMEEYAETTDDEELMEFVLRSFEWARSLGANLELIPHSYQLERTPGCGLIGFFPEWVRSPHWQTSETCQASDMIALALRLSEAGIGDYWDDADRWIRNQFAEAQLRSTDWVRRLSVKAAATEVPFNGTADRVAERNLGAFAGSPSANDWFATDIHAIGHCCTANGSKGLYGIWERILLHQNGHLQVNLLLNRASPWADVDSYIPYQGRVDVRAKQPLDLSIRIPEWVEPEQTRCLVNGTERRLGWRGRYAQLGAVAPGDVATLEFPIGDRTDVIHIEKQPFTVVRKGNEVVSIDPPGRNHPLYQRERYRQHAPRWRKVDRFISSERIEW